jgi:endonuclease-8
MRMVSRTHYADLRGPTACELIDAEVDAVHARLGEDPLPPDADPDRACARISRSRAPLATLLMDQKVIAGVGNVFRAAALFRTGLDPHLPGRELGRERWERLWADLAAMLRDGERRRPCLVCATPIACETHLARNLFLCPRCQAA